MPTNGTPARHRVLKETIMRTDYDPPQEIEDLIARLRSVADGHEPQPYPHDAEDEHGGQDDLDELGAPGDAPHTSLEAVQLGWDLVRERIWFGVGYCLKTIRSLFGVASLYPDAETAWENAEARHATSSSADIPWGVPVWWVNGRYGHVALSLGKGRCLTTDYVETGRLGLAQISSLGPWCGGRLVGWSQDINGVTVWRPKAKPQPWGIDERIAFVRHALERAIANEAPERRVKGLRRWLHRMEDRRDGTPARG